MFCPNCAAQNDASQHYCRLCGLKLDAIAAELTVQNPSEEVAALLKKKRYMELLGKSALGISGIIGICLVFTLAVYYLVSIVFLAYPKFFLKIDGATLQSPEQPKLTTPTGKLLNDPPFEPASVTEHSTELLTPKIDSKR